MQTDKTRVQTSLPPLRYRVYSIRYQDPAIGWQPLWVFYESQNRQGETVVKRYRQSGFHNRPSILFRKLEELTIFEMPGKPMPTGQSILSGILTTSELDELRSDWEAEEARLGPSLLHMVSEVIKASQQVSAAPVTTNLSARRTSAAVGGRSSRRRSI